MPGDNTAPGYFSPAIIGTIAPKSGQVFLVKAGKMVENGVGGLGKILVVDDSDDIRLLLTETLTRNGYAVVSAGDGEEGVRTYFEHPNVCLVITDMDMPVLNGLGLIKKLRAAKAGVPIVVLSGRNDEDTAIRAVHAGADDYIVKDENIRDEILLHARKVFELRKITDENKRLYALLEARNRFIKKTFGRYMSDEVVEKLLESPDGLKLGGESLKATVMMTDLRGFSAVSEAYGPEIVMDMLNGYLKEMTGIISKHSGVINEIIGDALLVLFGAPVSRPDDAARAIACAVEMQLAMENVNRRNRELGLMELVMGIGMNTGMVVAGNIGSDIRAKYAVVGSVVNLAGRVESLTVGGQILATESVLKDAGAEVQTGGEFLIPFKGFGKPSLLYDVMGIKGKFNLSLPNKDMRFAELKSGIAVECETLKEKHSTGEKFHAAITGLAGKGALIRPDKQLAPFSNIKLSLTGNLASGREAPLYAKVTKEHGDGTYEVTFTFIPREIRDLFSKLV